MKTDCQDWNRSRHRQGYGRLNQKGKDRYAHRQAWIDENGPIPEGSVILHKCDNPSCVNVDHLRIGTQSDNIADRVKKDRSAKGLSNARTKATPDVINTIMRSRLSSRKLASLLGISHTTVLDVRRGKQYLAKTERAEDGKCYLK